MKRRTQRLHAAMRDTHCPMCGQVIRRSHNCQGRPPQPLTTEQLAANVAACKAAIHTDPRPVEEPLPLALPQEQSWGG